MRAGIKSGELRGWVEGLGKAERKVWEKVCKQDCRLEREKACSVRRWLTWAFVGRRWEALPRPHILNAKQHCYCVRRAAAAAWTSRRSGNQ